MPSHNPEPPSSNPYATNQALRKYSITKPSPLNPTPRSWDFTRSPSTGRPLKPLTTAQKYAQLERKKRVEKAKRGVLTNAAFLGSIRREIENPEEFLMEMEDEEGMEERDELTSSAFLRSVRREIEADEGDDEEVDIVDENEAMPEISTSEQEKKKKRKRASPKTQKPSKKQEPLRKLSTTGVLFRPTKRAQQQRADWGQTSLVLPNVRGNKGKHAKKKNQKAEPRVTILDLDTEDREKIWRYALVDSTQWIDVGSDGGREQPDLAMVNRQIRQECLPIYYAENIFGCMLGGSSDRPRRGSKEPTGIQALSKWAAALPSKKNEAGEWFGFIQRWCFVYRIAGPAFDGVEYDEDDFVFYMAPGEAGNYFEIHSRVECVLSGGEHGVCQFPVDAGHLLPHILEITGDEGKISSGKVVTKLAGVLLGMRRDLKLVKCQPSAPGPQVPENWFSKSNQTTSLDWLLSGNLL